MSTVTPKTILLMDDSPLVLEMAAAALTAAGYRALTASTLDELEELRTRNQPDLILLDVQMPEAFGDDIATVLRAVRAVDVPIALFSNVGDRELLLRAREAGVEGFISKRSGLDGLVAQVGQLLAGRKEAP